MAVLSRLLNKVFCCSEKELELWQGGREREREREMGQGILRRTKGNIEQNRMIENDGEAGRWGGRGTKGRQTACTEQ